MMVERKANKGSINCHNSRVAFGSFLLGVCVTYFHVSTGKKIADLWAQHNQLAKKTENSEVFNNRSSPFSFKEKRKRLLDLQNSPAVDRDLNGVTVDLAYTLHIPSNWWDDLHHQGVPSFDDLMTSLHGQNIWKERGLREHIEYLDLTNPPDLLGSPLGSLGDLLTKFKPRIFLEVGVFHGATSTRVAKFFQSNNEFQKSLDTWLLDLQFTWTGPKSKNKVDKSHNYFSDERISGGSKMYYQFLSNCINSNVVDRIIPLPTATQNGAMTLLSHGVRPDFMYIDASHSNPDVFIDFENFYKILKPGGTIAFDDLEIVPSTQTAFERLVERYGLRPVAINRNQAYITKRG